MFIRTGFALALALVCVSAAAQEGRISWTTGVEYSSGDYGGSDDIEDIYVPATGRVEFERVSLALTVPYLSVRAPAGSIVTDPGGEPVTGTGASL